MTSVSLIQDAGCDGGVIDVLQRVECIKQVNMTVEWGKEEEQEEYDTGEEEDE